MRFLKRRGGLIKQGQIKFFLIGLDLADGEN